MLLEFVFHFIVTFLSFTHRLIDYSFNRNYRPQILVLAGSPSCRPILVNFGYLLTKKLSMLVVGHVMKQQISQKYRNFLLKKSNEWCKRHKVKAFYSLVDDNDFENGCRALMQATGIGKLRPNILMMGKVFYCKLLIIYYNLIASPGYKNDWRTCDRSELEKYFNIVHKAFDLDLAVAILRVPIGLDYSHILGDDAPKHIKDAPKTLPSNDSSTDLVSREKNSSIHGSCDSLSRNISQGIIFDSKYS